MRREEGIASTALSILPTEMYILENRRGVVSNYDLSCRFSRFPGINAKHGMKPMQYLNCEFRCSSILKSR